MKRKPTKLQVRCDYISMVTSRQLSNSLVSTPTVVFVYIPYIGIEYQSCDVDLYRSSARIADCQLCAPYIPYIGIEYVLSVL